MISLGLLTSPLPFMFLGAVIGALLAAAIGFSIAGQMSSRRGRQHNARQVYERGETIALRRVVAACDRGEEHHRIRRIASGALYPHVLELQDDAPIIPEARHG